MKKIYKLLIFVFIVFGLVCTSISISAVDTIPDDDIENIEETPQPSEFALWIEENVIQVAIGIGTGVITFIIALWRIIIFIKKVLDKIKKEREITNELHNNSTLSFNEFTNDLKRDFASLLNDLKATKEQSAYAIEKIDKFVTDTIANFERLTNGQILFGEMLKLTVTNIPELVRNGTAERIIKLYERVMVYSDDGTTECKEEIKKEA
jgi:hypothetical protein